MLVVGLFWVGCWLACWEVDWWLLVAFRLFVGWLVDGVEERKPLALMEGRSVLPPAIAK